MKIPQETIEQIHQSIEIADVIGDFVTLKKKGQYLMACCPFHNEKTPSFTVTPAKGIYKCFGCGKAGDAIQFVMEMEGLSYVEAMKFFAKKYGIEISEAPLTGEEILQQTERDSLYIVLNYAKNYFHETLLNHEEGRAIGLSYFKERGFPDEIIRKFELGYSLEEWEAFTKEALKNNYKLELLEKAGLTLTRENANDKKTSRHYDRFRGRVIFPIHNVTGKVIAFGARILKNDRSQPKYLNSPESEVYHKSSILYGIFQAKNAIRNEDNCYLTEGYTDVIALHMAGVENAVASSGTSLTIDQIRLISRYTKNVTVLYDGDSAGIKASIRGIDMILEEGLNVSIVLFPEGEDPDSYSRKIGAAEFREYIQKEKKDFITFKTELFLKDAGNDPLKKAEVIREIVVSISKIPDAIKRAVFFKQCSITLAIDEQALISEYNKILMKKRQEKKESPEEGMPAAEEELPQLVNVPTHELDIIYGLERSVIRLLVSHGAAILEGEEPFPAYLLEQLDDLEFHHPLYKRMLEMIHLEVKQGNGIKEEYFLRHPEEDIRKEAIDLLTSRYGLSHNWEKFKIFVPAEGESLPQVAYLTILRLKYHNVQLLIKENNENILKAQQENNSEGIDTFMRMHIRLKESGKELAGLLGNVVWR